MVSDEQQHSMRLVVRKERRKNEVGPHLIKKKSINQTNVKLIFNHLVGSVFLLHNNHKKYQQLPGNKSWSSK